MTNPTTTALPATATEAVAGLDLTGKVFVVTGGYSGLGAATSKALASTGATVVLAGRNKASQSKFANEVRAAFPNASIDADEVVDLGDLSSVAAFGHHIRSRYDRIDCLMNNAGVMNTPPESTKDGFEVQFGTNVVGHFLLSRLLVDQTERQVWLSSSGHTLIGDPPGNHGLAKAPRIDIDATKTVNPDTYDSWRRYQQSKLGAILLAKQFAIEHPHLKTCSVHPGVVRTNLGRHMSIWLMMRYVAASLFGRTQAMVGPDAGARTQTLCAVTPSDDLENGAYYADCVPTTPADAAQNIQDAKRLYDFCEEVT